MSSSARTIRFSDLVKHFGPAHLVTLWSDPKTDKIFMRAVEENRVITIALQNVGTRKDFGVVGFDPKPSATYIVFSKRLSAANGTKIVGVKYDLLEEAPVKDPIPPSEPQPRVRRQGNLKHSDARSVKTSADSKVIAFPQPQIHSPKFKVTISVSTKSRQEKEIQAANAKEARAKALKEVKNEPVDVTNAAITRRVISTKQVV